MHRFDRESVNLVYVAPDIKPITMRARANGCRDELTRPVRHDDGALRQHSLRWRLPTFICGLFLVALMVVVYAAYREVEMALHRAGAERAQHAADQVAALVGRSTQQTFDQLQRVTAAPALRRYLKDPTSENLVAAQAAVEPLAPPGASRRITLWSPTGARMLEIAVPTSMTNGVAQTLPEASRPADAGFGPLQIVDGRVVSDTGAPIDDDPSSTSPATQLGSLGLRTTISMSPPDALSRLVGPDARVLVGNRTGNVWTDLVHIVSPPAVDLAGDGIREYHAADGNRRVGALAGLRGTPWVVWVELSRTTIVAQAKTFLERMVPFGLVVAIVTGLGVRLLTVSITTPLADMTRAAEGMADGDYSRRVSNDRADEIGRLGRAFNTMTTQVADAYHRLEHMVEERTRELNEALTTLSQRSQDREAYLATIVDSSEDAIIGTSLDGMVQSWNRGAQQLYGYAASEMIGRAIEGIVPSDRANEWSDLLRRLVRGEHIHHFDTMRLRKDGSRVQVSLTVSPIHDTAGQLIGASAVARDMTQQTLLEEQLRQAQKMEAIGQLAGGIAHDFNNVLTAILGFSELQIAALSPDDPVRADLLEINNAGERAAGLTRQLLAFSRKQILQPKILDANALVGGLEPMLRRVIIESVDLKVSLAPRVGLIKMDPTQLEQILVNLTVNAADAMPRGGRLTIETTNVTLDEDYQQRHLPVTAGDYTMVAVSDTGVGMDEATCQRIFEPFFTTKEVGKGTGLGLATVYGIVKQSGGDIWVYSQPGMGTTFKIYLPQVTSTERGVVAPVLEAANTRGSETVLLVEDDDAVRRLAHVTLERAGYHVYGAPNPKAAVQLVAGIEEGIDLLLSDVVMPESEGPPLVERLASRQPGLRVLYMSGYADEAIIRHGVLVEGTPFLQKPFTPHTLRRKVREVLDALP